ncbi:endonuclease 2-like [Vigna unguiculata]|uniref:endonuclease 2-like n=1 Tax=Vigna unguiculata TaxID=3917 RepID=UPI001015D966|nr:endonuclease 2-like [Vigna unguiculata]
MSHFSIQFVAILSLTLLLPNTHGWGDDGHVIVCKIAQARLSKSAAEAVKNLLPKSAENDLSKRCSWADHVHHIFPWSSALHYANTPDAVCSYKNSRDCIDYKKGIKGRCVVAAINNFTTQLLEYGSETKSKYNLTQSLFFLSHFVGDIHQPLHCGFISDSGGNKINVHWYKRKQNLHHVWDHTILQTEVDRFYDSDMDEFVDAIQQNITKVWADEVEEWEHCADNDLPCAALYASESTIDACKWAYKDATEGSVLKDDYFLSRSPIVNLRLAQAGVRLAAILNRVFDRKLSSSM